MDTPPKAAVQVGLNSLYHYQDFDLKSSDDHAGRLRDILKNHRIWCSNPANFNDPWDGKPYFDPAFLDDPEVRAFTAEAIISTRKGGPELGHIDYKLRTDPKFLKAALHQFSVQMFDFIASRWGVFCLSPNPSLTLMWSHYGRNHKGICLEFNVPNTKFRGALEVQYQKEYPKFLLHAPGSYLSMLLTKSDDWMYEQEFRLLCPRFTDVKESPLIMDGNYLNIGASDLTSIILGCQVTDEAALTIQDLVQQYSPHVKVRQARRALNKYHLVVGDRF
ncbi:MAG TPA: DUF2971 domain-containing protein [Bryobacteraceae bacterium]|nr:DUF2971 domain-containing protein [Bryobacteraceae bacterium]